MTDRTRSISDRIRARIVVDDQTGCWIWQGSRNSGGYGKIWVDDHLEQAHRAMYEAEVAPIPSGMQLDHLCHTHDKSCTGGSNCPHRSCVNPAHLEPVTQKENLNRGIKLPPRANPLQART